ncbi:Uu.00g121370.m01.CDS01 [Anthostomella pinea]|uniref:Uu.00g121370.m01.CDS01 n=1 Tax=Anthostomella pinea TaxID=933095 RepID=A0AAI8VH14_9PEZI|nr:Uu.00g121370.m01.CDS01 [Anthostomella pinea]
MRQSRLVAFQVASLSLVFLTIWAGFHSLASESWTPWRRIGLHPSGSDIQEVADSAPELVDGLVEAEQSGKEHQLEPVDKDPPFNTTPFITAVLDSADTTLPRLECPAPNTTRYGYLKAVGPDEISVDLRYFFALDLRQSVEVIPRLLGSIVEAIRFLGPSACGLSNVEGHSEDGTLEILHALQPELAELGIAYYVRSSALDPATGERITRLAQLGNLALAPLVSPGAIPPAALTRRSLPVPVPDSNTTIVFLNDVAACVTDILELVH